MGTHSTVSVWPEHTDDFLLHALVQGNQDALLELHRRYAPEVYALAQREQHLDLERRVQDAWVFIWRHAHGYGRSSLNARRWLLGMAHRALTTPVGP